MNESARLASKGNRLRLRQRLLQSIRRFFEDRGFLEVTTPILSPTVIPEEYIDPLEGEGGFLLPSPEIYMKRLLAAGYDKIFQVAPCFRKGERGSHHLPEFTILEWYRARSDYRVLCNDCEELLAALAVHLFSETRLCAEGRDLDLSPPWPRVPVQEAFRRLAGWDPLEEEDPERFQRDLAEKVIPGLDRKGPVFLVDFPAYEASLARRKSSDPRVAERVELFAAGLELANGFSELTDEQEQRARFEEANKKRAARGSRTFVLPGRFLDAVSRLPPSAGIALGVDRLVMLFTGASHIEEVVPFAPEDL